MLESRALVTLRQQHVVLKVVVSPLICLFDANLF